jgi:hypothetical protein
MQEAALFKRNQLSSARSLNLRPVLGLLAATILAGCTTQNTSTSSQPRIPLAPTCAVNWTSFFDNPEMNSPNRSWRIDATANSGFDRSRSPRVGLGDGLVGIQEVVAFDEVWFRHPFEPQMILAQVVPITRASAIVPNRYNWSISATDARGVRSAIIGTGGMTPQGQTETRESAAEMLPRFMPVGVFTPQMFACVRDFSDDQRVLTTRLVEIIPPAQSSPASIMDIQDLLSGDTRFVPSAPGPLRGPALPPVPTLSGTGAPVTSGVVKCAMLQRDDDVTTRTLHMLVVHNGMLLHSLASNFSNPQSNGGTGSTLTRFNAISPWGNVGDALGGGFGTITSASVVPAGPGGISVYFMAEKNGRYRLYHATRLQNGTWSAVEDVLALNGDAPNGTVYRYDVEANICPEPNATSWTNANTEQLITLQGGANPYTASVIRRTPVAREWVQGITSRYSQRISLPLYYGSYADGQQRNVRIPFLRVSGRAFSTDTPPPAPPAP